MANERNPLVGWGYLLLGLGLTAEGFRSVTGKASPANLPFGNRGIAGLGNAEGAAMRKAGGVIEKAKTHTVRNIDERVRFIKERVQKDSLKPVVREKALAVLTRKCPVGNGKVDWCVEPKNYEAEIKALYNAVQDPNSPIALRYTRDHVYVDQFTAADKLMRLNGGDCDDGTILLGAMLRTVGYPIKMRVIQDKGSPTWSHIYLLVGIPPGGGSMKWVPLDWSVYPYKPPGWEAPGAAQAALSGRPAGIVEKVRDYDV